MPKYTVSFKVSSEDYLIRLVGKTEKEFFQDIENSLEDLLKVSVLPTLNLRLEPLSFEVKRARK
jgi:hypothetical protein